MKTSLLLKKTLVGCTYIGVLAFAPVAFDFDSGAFTFHAAFAKGGNGGGNSGGNGNGNSNGNSNGNANGHSNTKGNSGNSSSNGLGNDKGSLASALGRLNAAHASENALAHASVNSVVGALAQYKAAVLASNTLIEEANGLDPDDPANTPRLDEITAELNELSQVEADALTSAANKEITEEVQDATDELLGIEHLTLSHPEDPAEPPQATVTDTSTTQ